MRDARLAKLLNDQELWNSTTHTSQNATNSLNAETPEPLCPKTPFGDETLIVTTKCANSRFFTDCYPNFAARLPLLRGPGDASHLAIIANKIKYLIS